MVLSDYKSILLAYKQKFWDSQGADGQDFVQEIMQDIVVQGKGTLDKKTLKGLDAVSPYIQTSSDIKILFTWT